MSTNPFESPNPYASPKSIGPTTHAGADKRQFPYMSARPRATFTVCLLALNIIISVVAITQAFSQIDLVQRMIAGQAVNEGEIQANQQRAIALAVVDLIVLVATYVCFLMWIHRAHRNLPALGAEGLEYTPRWAVGAWFVPFLNLWRPFQIMSEIWKASDPQISSTDGRRWKLAEGSTLLGTWWAAWLAAIIVNRISSRMDTDTAPEILNSTWAVMIAEILMIPAGLLAIQVVRSITSRQEEKALKAEMNSDRPAGGPNFNFT